jgi:hypothetical protein
VLANKIRCHIVLFLCFLLHLLFSTISLIPQNSTTIMPQVGGGGIIVAESRKNGHFFRGIIWWNYLVGSSEFCRPPARLPVAAPPRAPPRALGSGHPAPRRRAVELHSPPARSAPLSQVNGLSSYRRYKLSSLTGTLAFSAPSVIPPQRKLPTPKANAQGTYFAVANKWHHISPLRRCLGQPRRHLR